MVTLASIQAGLVQIRGSISISPLVWSETFSAYWQ
jgi:hypothetical protein